MLASRRGPERERGAQLVVTAGQHGQRHALRARGAAGGRRDLDAVAQGPEVGVGRLRLREGDGWRRCGGGGGRPSVRSTGEGGGADGGCDHDGDGREPARRAAHSGSGRAWTKQPAREGWSVTSAPAGTPRRSQSTARSPAAPAVSSHPKAATPPQPASVPAAAGTTPSSTSGATAPRR